MRKFILAAAAVGAISAVSIAPAEAHWVHRGWGPGIGFGLAAGALAFGAAAAAAQNAKAASFSMTSDRVNWR